MASFLVPLITTAIGAIGGGLANRASKQQQESTTTNNSTQTTNPNYDPKMQDIRDRVLNELLFRTESAPDFAGKYTAEGLANINKTRDSSKAAIDNILAARGFSGSPVAASAQVQNEVGVAGQKGTFLNSVPMMMEELRRQRMSDLTGFFSGLPVGQTGTTTGTSTTNGTVTNPGNSAAGALSGGGQSLGLLYGLGAFNKKPATGLSGMLAGAK